MRNIDFHEFLKLMKQKNKIKKLTLVNIDIMDRIFVYLV